MTGDQTDGERFSISGALSLSVLHCPFEFFHWPSVLDTTQRAGGNESAMAEDPTDGPEDGGEVVVPIEDWLDLHVFAPRDIPALVSEYLEECTRRGFREVRLIHGRGTGTQRAIVRSLLASHPLVLDFGDAPPDRGGWGATIVQLRVCQPGA